MFIIKRNDIPSITSIMVDNEKHELGILKDFKKHPLLSQYLPENTRLSLSWVRLKKGETLAIHQHPTTSMIIVTEGQVTTLGNDNKSAEAGDVILIPPNVLHGFIGAGQDGLWGLSLQFEGTGLYEDESNPRVTF